MHRAYNSRPALLGATSLVLLLAAALPALGQDWVEFADETSTRLVSDTGVGATDPVEKDVISGDVDRDGDRDVLVARKARFSTPGGETNVLFMNENGVMTDRTSTLAPDFLDPDDARDLVLVDVDGDGWLDVVTVTTFSEQPRILMNLGNDGGGVWQGFLYTAADNRLPVFSPAPKFCAVGFGDVTGNGFPDLFFVDYDNNLEDRLLINDGTGVFTDETDTRMTAAMSESVFGTDSHILDINGDGFNDLVKNYASGSSPPPGTISSVRVLYNDGTGNFDFMDFVYAPASGGPYMIEPADWNRDGRPDIYVVDDEQDVYLTNQGNDLDGRATWTTTAVTNSPITEGFGGNVKIGDLDSDGIVDIVVADVDTDLAGCDRRMTILRGQRSGGVVTYTDPFNGADRSWLTLGTFDIELVDLDGDANLDMWLGTCDGTEIQINTSNAGIFVEGFESGGFENWTSVLGGP